MTDSQRATADSPQDALLLQRAGAGEQAALDDLADRHREPVARFAAELTDHAAEAHGVVALSFEALRERAATDSESVGAVRPFLLASVAELLTGADAAESAQSEQPSFEGWDDLDATAQTALWHTEVEQDPPSVVARIAGADIDSVHATAENARLEVRGNYLESHLPTLPRAGCRENWFRLTDRPHDALDDAGIEEHARDCEACGTLLADARLTWTQFDEILTAQLLGPAAPAFVAARDASPAVEAAAVPAVAPVEPEAGATPEVTAEAPAEAPERRPATAAVAAAPVMSMSGAAPAESTVAWLPESHRPRRGLPGVLAASAVAASVLLVVSAGILVDRGSDGTPTAGSSDEQSSTMLVATTKIAPTPTLVTIGARSLTPSADENVRDVQRDDAADPESDAVTDPTTDRASNEQPSSPDEPESPEASPPPSDSSTPSPSGSDSQSPSEPTESASDSESPSESESPTESPSDSESPTASPSESGSSTTSPSGSSSATPSE